MYKYYNFSEQSFKFVIKTQIFWVYLQKLGEVRRIYLFYLAPRRYFSFILSIKNCFYMFFSCKEPNAWHTRKTGRSPLLLVNCS